MNCTQVMQQLWPYLDGELDAETSGELSRHLEECRRCFPRAEFERNLRAMVRRSCNREQASPELQARVRRLLRLF